MEIREGMTDSEVAAEVKAEKLLDRAADVVAAPPPPSAAPKVKGVADRKVAAGSFDFSPARKHRMTLALRRVMPCSRARRAALGFCHASICMRSRLP